MPTSDNLLTRQEAAVILDVHLQTVNNWLRSGVLTRLKHPNRYNVYIDRHEVETVLAKIRRPEPE